MVLFAWESVMETLAFEDPMRSNFPRRMGWGEALASNSANRRLDEPLLIVRTDCIAPEFHLMGRGCRLAPRHNAVHLNSWELCGSPEQFSTGAIPQLFAANPPLHFRAPRFDSTPGRRD